ncbi:MAG: hypothetical protein FJ284_15510 [Planctomycetes bacterium]|nr:hypothetical protein [Planctomycetota bacterium]
MSRDATKVAGIGHPRRLRLGLGLAACQNGFSVGFTTAAALVPSAVRQFYSGQPMHFYSGVDSFQGMRPASWREELAGVSI